MKLIFPGTGSGVISSVRNHTSLVFQDEKNILIDTGDGIARALSAVDIIPSDIDIIIISHLHPDHFSGLASLITQMKLGSRKAPLKIFAHSGLIKNIRYFLNMSNIFPEVLAFPIDFCEMEPEKKYALTTDIKVEMFVNNHITNKHNLKDYPEIFFVSCSFKFFTERKNIFYTADLRDSDDFDLFEPEDIEVLVSELTHFSLANLLNKIKKSNLKQLYLTHIPDEIREQLRVDVEVMQQQVSFKIFIADDGMKINLI